MVKDIKYSKPFLLDMDGVEIALDDGSGQAEDFEGSENAFFMFKSEAYLEAYADLKARLTVKRLLEIGIYRGGSTVFFDRFFRPDTLVAVEFSPDRLAKVDTYIANQAVANMTVYHGVDQGSAAQLSPILDAHFADGLDLVIDDASHWYEETKASFETVFPYVRPGGWYVIEDWPWAHAPPWQEPGNLWEEKSALSNLVFEILVAHGTNTNLIDLVIFSPGLMYMRRGGLVLPRGKFRLCDYQLARGRTLPKI